MIYSLRNLRFPVQREYDLEGQIAAKLGLPSAAFSLLRITRKAVDTRRRNHPFYDFSVQLSFADQAPRHPDLNPLPEHPIPPVKPIFRSDPHPFIIGMGPAGLFCALAMVANGFQPCLFDQGDAIEERARAVNKFWQDGRLDENSNVQFGEGGAGAFSDGKLTCRNRDHTVQQVLEQLIGFGAPPEIAFEALPHLGTDGIRTIVKNIRHHLQEQGCQFYHRHTLQDIRIAEWKLIQATINGSVHTPETLILALGNSARASFRMLHRRGIALEPKAFAVGFRIEQSQSTINRLIYGSESWAEILGPASYRLANPDGFTFCMCPGGFVISAPTESRGMVTNGMSYAARDNAYCNSAVVTPVDSEVYGSGLFAGIDFQQLLEHRAFQPSWQAPAILADDFLQERLSTRLHPSSFTGSLYCGDFSTIFPAAVLNRLKSALQKFATVIKEFNRNAVLIAPETRTSSPLRLLRDQDSLNSLSASNLYPIGEGSGYAGGIISSAGDGWRLGTRFRLRKE